jgi:hypothetical protein
MSGDQSINPWNYKPWWCQPWSISLTGTGLIAGSWWLGHRLWLTVLVALPILAWMGFFLLLWPRLVRQSWNELQQNEQQE